MFPLGGTPFSVIPSSGLLREHLDHDGSSGRRLFHPETPNRQRRYSREVRIIPCSTFCENLSRTTALGTLGHSTSKVNSSQQVSVACERSKLVSTCYHAGWREYSHSCGGKGGDQPFQELSCHLHPEPAHGDVEQLLFSLHLPLGDIETEPINASWPGNSWFGPTLRAQRNPWICPDQLLQHDSRGRQI